MKKNQKFIAIIIVIGLILSINFNLFFLEPKKAQALDGGGSWMQAIKEIVLDAIGWVISDVILRRLETKIIAWGRGEESDSGEPLAVSDYAIYFAKAVALGTAEYIAEFDALWDETDRFEKDVRDTLENLGVTTLYQDMQYARYAQPTLMSDIDYNYQAFINSGYSFQYGGWGSWFSMIKPENNIFGQYLMAVKARSNYERASKEVADKETDVSGGYENEKVTTLTSIDKCKSHCENTYGANDFVTQEAYQRCIARCDTRMGVPLETTVKNLGTTIEKYTTDALGKDFSRIISADEISELIGIFFSSVLNKAIDGLGLGFSNKTTDSSTIARNELKEQYSYNRDFKKDQTPEERKEFRSNLLTNVQKAIQQLSRSIVACDKKEMMKIDNYTKNLADIFAPNVEALYVGLEGINLKPDFEILDGHSVPYSVYGYSWNKLPYQKFPSKCKKITDQLSLGETATCKNILSGLEPNNYIDSRCEQCVYDDDALNCPDAPYPPFSSGEYPSKAQYKVKADFYNACKGPYNVVLDRCDECIKKVDERCEQDDEDQRDECIKTYCDIYNNTYVKNNIVDGLEFYGRCLIEEKKETCYTCLKEYFVPADYCYQMEDYMSRSIAKYPAIVINPETGKSFFENTFTTLGGIWTNLWKAKNQGMFVGPIDDYIYSMGGKCKNNLSPETKISTALFCRILPGFEFQGEKVCETRCSVSKEELNDITDFKPSHEDCGDDRLDIGGNNPTDFIKAGLLKARSKCCAALWQYDPISYKICLGEGTPAPPPPDECDWGSPANEEPQCYCPEDYRPLGFARVGGPEKGPRIGGVCSYFDFDSPNREIFAYTDNHPAAETAYIAYDKCTIDSNDGTGVSPSDVIWEERLTNGIREVFYLDNLIGVTGALYGGVYSDASGENAGDAGIVLCDPCDEDDDGYPEYDTGIDQCTGKIINVGM